MTEDSHPIRIVTHSVVVHSVLRQEETMDVVILPIHHNDVTPTRLGIKLLITSSFGNFGHEWTHCGVAMGDPLQAIKWLRNLNKEYFLGKISANPYVFDVEATWKAFDSYLKNDAQSDGYGNLEIEEAENVLAGCVNESLHALLDEMAGTRVFRDSYTDPVVRKLDPALDNFWETLWLPYIKIFDEGRPFHGEVLDETNTAQDSETAG